MIINDLYYKALDFAKTLHPSAPTDPVHDAFVDWHNRFKTNLFDEPESMVMYMVQTMFDQKYRGKSHRRFTDKIKQTLVTPEDELVERELGLSFMSFEEIEARVDDYELYHKKYKIHLN
jgi:hypothetical protein